MTYSDSALPAGIRAGPPAVPFVLAVGVTGHRADVLPEGSVPILRDRVRDVLMRIAEAGRDLLEQERDCFAPTVNLKLLRH